MSDEHYTPKAVYEVVKSLFKNERKTNNDEI